VSGVRVTTTAEVAKELGTYAAERQEEIHAALDRLADASALGVGAPDGVGLRAEVLPGMFAHWVLLEQPRLAIVWQVVVAA
jgi:plasmid stabilization system protein ParE